MHFLRSVLFYRTLARSFLANFMESITFKAIPHNWTKTPQLSLCGVALKKLWMKRKNGRLKTHLSPGTEKGLPQNSSSCDRPFVHLIALSAFYFLMMFSHQRCMIAAISARVAVPVGARRLSSLPFSTPAPTAHCRAGIAYSLACPTST